LGPYRTFNFDTILVIVQTMT